jgi:dTDP-glucose 4,6-dehydratase
MRLLACGWAGFIGSTVRPAARRGARRRGDRPRQAHIRREIGNLQTASSDIRFVHGAIEDRDAVMEAVSGCEAILNFAAETHVDRSIADPEGFIVTNMRGTHVILDAARERALRYLQVFTDGV